VCVCYLTAGKLILKCRTVFSVLSTVFFKPHDSVFYSFRYIVTKKKVVGFQDAKTYATEVMYYM